MTSRSPGDSRFADPRTQERSPSAGEDNGRTNRRSETILDDTDDAPVDTSALEREVSAALRPPPAETAPPAFPPGPRQAPGEPEPAHVSEEPALVEEFAEPGAEDGAGAEVHINPPWEGYAELNAKQIVARLSSATPAELAAVELYEGSHRRRQTILNAVKRELRSANGRSTESQQGG